MISRKLLCQDSAEQSDFSWDNNVQWNVHDQCMVHQWHSQFCQTPGKVEVFGPFKSYSDEVHIIYHNNVWEKIFAGRCTVWAGKIFPLSLPRSQTRCIMSTTWETWNELLYFSRARRDEGSSLFLIFKRSYENFKILIIYDCVYTSQVSTQCVEVRHLSSEKLLWLYLGDE